MHSGKRRIARHAQPGQHAKGKSSAVEVIQIANCVNATGATPRIFPASSSNGRTDEINTSIVRVVFSSITERMVMRPYISSEV